MDNNNSLLAVVTANKSIWTKDLKVYFFVSLFKLLAFDIVWSLATTFSAFSFPLLWINTIAVAFIVTIPYGIFRRKWL
jgi:hypothetical protein